MTDDDRLKIQRLKKRDALIEMGIDPYGGRFAEVVPHLTVADTAEGPPASLGSELAAGLPIAAVATEVWLMEEARDGTWSTRAAFPLGAWV